MPLFALETTGWSDSMIANLEGQLDKIEKYIEKSVKHTSGCLHESFSRNNWTMKALTKGFISWWIQYLNRLPGSGGTVGGWAW